jgi:hypothetical protein
LNGRKEENHKMRYYTGPGMPAILFLLIVFIIMPVICGAVSKPEDEIRLYDEAMLLRDLQDKTGKPADTQEPLIQTESRGKQTAIEVPRSIKYDTSLLEEGVKFFRTGNYREAASSFETALQTYRKQGFIEGEIALLGNLYLTYHELGDEGKALKYLEAHRKKRRQK